MTGGADPERVQMLFAKRYLAEQQHPKFRGIRTWAQAKEAVRERFEKLAGRSERFWLDDLDEDEDLSVPHGLRLAEKASGKPPVLPLGNPEPPPGFIAPETPPWLSPSSR